MSLRKAIHQLARWSLPPLPEQAVEMIRKPILATAAKEGPPGSLGVRGAGLLLHDRDVVEAEEHVVDVPPGPGPRRRLEPARSFGIFTNGRATSEPRQIRCEAGHRYHVPPIAHPTRIDTVDCTLFADTVKPKGWKLLINCSTGSNSGAPEGLVPPASGPKPQAFDGRMPTDRGR